MFLRARHSLAYLRSNQRQRLTDSTTIVVDAARRIAERVFILFKCGCRTCKA